MRRSHLILLVVALALFSGTVQAKSISWKYAEFGWGRFDPDRGNEENGWFAGGSVNFGPIHVFGDYGDFGPLDNWQVGAGWHGLLGKRADLFADAAFYDVDYDDGIKVRFGARWLILDWFELNGNLAWTELGDFRNYSALVNTIFELGNHFALGVGYEWGDELSTARAYARIYFGSRN